MFTQANCSRQIDPISSLIITRIFTPGNLTGLRPFELKIGTPATPSLRDAHANFDFSILFLADRTLLCYDVVSVRLSDSCLSSVTYVLWLNGAFYRKELSKEANRVARKLPCGTTSDPLQPSIPPKRVMTSPQILAWRIVAKPL